MIQIQEKEKTKDKTNVIPVLGFRSQKRPSSVLCIVCGCTSGRSHDEEWENVIKASKSCDRLDNSGPTSLKYESTQGKKYSNNGIDIKYCSGVFTDSLACLTRQIKRNWYNCATTRRVMVESIEKKGD